MKILICLIILSIFYDRDKVRRWMIQENYLYNKGLSFVLCKKFLQIVWEEFKSILEIQVKGMNKYFREKDILVVYKIMRRCVIFFIIGKM